MANNTVHEIVVYIHGVSTDVKEKSHDENYSNFHNGVRKLIKSGWPVRYCGVEWGANLESSQTPENHQLLTVAQRNLGGRVMPCVDEASDFTVNPARLAANGFRKLAFYGFGDMFYYVSLDGKLAVRSATARTIVNYIFEKNINADDMISLTIVGHSAGSVIAFDFLFYLFSEHRDACDFVHRDQDTKEALKNLEQRTKDKNLRLRRLITIGSPITFVACRSNAVLEILSGGNQLNPIHYGLNSELQTGKPLVGPRWINIWDKDDPISWPVEPLMGNPHDKLVKDEYCDVSDRVTKAHNEYWYSSKVHKIVRSYW